MNFDELWELLITQDESVEIEAKKASQVGKSCWETISAFSNEPGLGGGYLVLGIKSPQDSEAGVYEIEGLKEPDKIQCDLASQCSEVFSSVIRPKINMLLIKKVKRSFLFLSLKHKHQTNQYISKK
ncbi:MAG: helix-turn-helix domain-containing protein [Pleurocapsa sp.]|mgnify:CR=1 FL=1